MDDNRTMYFEDLIKWSREWWNYHNPQFNCELEFDKSIKNLVDFYDTHYDRIQDGYEYSNEETERVQYEAIDLRGTITSISLKHSYDGKLVSKEHLKLQVLFAKFQTSLRYTCENPSSRQKMLKAEAPGFVEFYKAMGITLEQLNEIMEE